MATHRPPQAVAGTDVDGETLCCLRDEEAAGSNPVTPTSSNALLDDQQLANSVDPVARPAQSVMTGPAASAALATGPYVCPSKW
jgi:hypothetical protein